MTDNSDFHKLRRSIPKEVELAFLNLRKKAEKRIVRESDLVDPLFPAKHFGVVVGHFALIFCVEDHGDNGLCWHLSVSHEHRYPTWDEMMVFRSFFFDDDMEVIMVMPPLDEYINIHNNCFHLWHETKSHLVRL